jgi:AcrR family transcriptional regulator
MKLRRRAYHMVARAESASATEARILAAMQRLFVERRYEQITLAEVARRARVTPQTVLRRFGSKEGLLAAGAAAGRAEVLAQRMRAPVGDTAGAIANLFDHYEQSGPIALRLLEQEHLPEIAPLTRSGRALHAAWVERVFAPHLARLPSRACALRRAQLITLTDVYVWLLLRRTLRLSRARAERALLQMVSALVGRKGGR